MDEKDFKIKPKHVHRAMKNLSPERQVESPKRGIHTIHRSISFQGAELAADFVNGELKILVEICEQLLQECNMEPYPYHKKFRYDKDLVERALKIMKRNDLNGDVNDRR